MNAHRSFVQKFIALPPKSRLKVMKIILAEGDKGDGKPEPSDEEAKARLLASGLAPDELERFGRAVREAWAAEDTP